MHVCVCDYVAACKSRPNSSLCKCQVREKGEEIMVKGKEDKKKQEGERKIENSREKSQRRQRQSDCLCSIFLKCFACCPRLHHLNHIFALLPVTVIPPSLHPSPFPLSSHAPSSLSGAVTFPTAFRTTLDDSSVVNLLREHRRGTDSGKKAALRCWRVQKTSDHVSRRQRLSVVSFF